MKTAQVAAVLASVAGSAFAQFPSCANSCVSQALNGFSGSFQTLCSDSGRLDTLNSCLSSSSGCSQSDRNTINSYISSNCGKAISGSGFPSQTFSSFGTFTTPFSGTYNPSAFSAYNSYTSAHPSGWNSADYSSFTSQYGPVPTGFNGGSGGFPGGFGGGFGGGWNPGSGAPFGGGNWGPFGQNGPWTSGAWTSWWDNNQCPPSSWSGWTSGQWSTSAPWTTWTACTARTTASSVYTTISNGQVTTATSFGYQVAQAQQTGSTNAAPVGKTVANGAAALAFLGAVLAA